MKRFQELLPQLVDEILILYVISVKSSINFAQNKMKFFPDETWYPARIECGHRGKAFLRVSDRDISSEVSFSFWQNYDCMKEASVIP